jgi:TRAP-type C4-dicarboxylate transport system substrate-binding protein
MLAGALRDAGDEPLAFAPRGHRALALAGRNVAAPAQLTGLRVRVPGSPAVADLYTALGALPRTLAFAEAQSAIAAGALDAQDGSPSAFVAARLDAVGMTQVLDWKAIAEIAVFAVNRGAWDRWSTSDRAVVRTAALQTAAELPAMVREDTDAALVDLRRRGFAVTRLTAAGHAAFAAAARDSYVKWAAIAGVELVRSAESQLHAVEP